MAAAPDDDARRTLAELEAKLRELERELLRGHEGEPVEAAAAEPAPPAAEAPPVADAPPAADAPHEPGPWGPGPDADEEGAAPEDADEPEWVGPEVPELATPERGAELLSAPEPELTAKPEPEPEPEEEPEPEPEPEPVLDVEALADVRELVAGLRSTIEDMGLTAERVTAEAQAVVDDHGRTLGRLSRAADAASRAEQAALEAGRLAATVVVEAGPFADAAAVTALRDTLAAQPGARDAYVRGVEDGRAVIEVHLVPPPS